MIFSERAELEASLKSFALALNREVGLRSGVFAAANAREQKMKTEGPVRVMQLTCVMDHVGVG